MSAYIGRFVFNGLAHPKYAIIRGIGVRCDLFEVIETGFGDGHPPPEFKIEKEKRGFSFFLPFQFLFSAKRYSPVLQIMAMQRYRICRKMPRQRGSLNGVGNSSGMRGKCVV